MRSKLLFLLLAIATPAWAAIPNIKPAPLPKPSQFCTLTVVVEDYPQSANHRYWCHRQNGLATAEIKVPKDFPHGKFKTGDQAHVIADVDTDANDQPVMYIDNSNIQFLTVPAGNPQFSTIPNNTLVLVVSFANRANQQSEAFIRDYYNRVVNPVLDEMSYHTARLVGIYDQSQAADVVAVTIPYAGESGGCDLFTITQQANTAAKVKGIDPSRAFPQYHRFSYHLPAPDGCGNMRGQSTVGWYGGSSITLVPVDDRCEVTCHELLGHSLAGLYHTHSNTLNSANCCIEEYGGDDYMGNHGGPLNPFQREIAGWYNKPKTSSGMVVTASGDYTIESIAIPTVGIKSLTIPTNDPNTNLYVTYYTQDGYNARLGSATRVSIYSGGAAAGSSYLLACKVAPAVQWSCGLGDTFSYLYQPIFITVKSWNATQAVVHIDFAPPPAPPAATVKSLILQYPTTAILNGQAVPLVIQ